MKKIIIIASLFLLIGTVVMSQTYSAKIVSDLTITSDTSFSLLMKDMNTWSYSVTWASNNATTSYIKVQESGNLGITWENYPSMDSVVVATSAGHAMFRGPSGCVGNMLRIWFHVESGKTMTINLWTVIRKW